MGGGGCARLRRLHPRSYHRRGSAGLMEEFPEDLGAYDSAGNYLGDVQRASSGPSWNGVEAPVEKPTLTVVENNRLDRMAILARPRGKPALKITPLEDVCCG